MNPYEADPGKIPDSDRFGDVPLYGRYFPRADDFKPEEKDINSSTPESLAYWESVLGICDANVRIYENQDGGRDVFALGSVIIKSSHLKPTLEGRRACRDYSFADANEVKTTALVRDVVLDVAVPDILFVDKIRGRAVLVQSRIPGVGLNIAWQYITAEQKLSFKSQARDLLRRMYSLSTPSSEPSYVVPDPDPVDHRGIQQLQTQLLFPPQSSGGGLGLMHNDLTHSNIIVDHDRIVGIVDWEMAGFFEWKSGANVHVLIRSPRKENYASLNLDEDFLTDILYWNDLYEV